MKKEKTAVWLYPQTKELIHKHLEKANSKSMSEYIEQAVQFYSGYLDCNSVQGKEYLASAVESVINDVVTSSEQKISRMLFKLAVDSAVQSHILSALHDIEDADLGQLYKKCTRDTHKANGLIDFRKAREYQKYG